MPTKITRITITEEQGKRLRNALNESKQRLKDALPPKYVMKFIEEKTKSVNELNGGKLDEDSFDIYNNACKKATELYRNDHPELPELTHPDTGKVVRYICEQIIDLRSEIKGLKEELRKETE